MISCLIIRIYRDFPIGDWIHDSLTGGLGMHRLVHFWLICSWTLPRTAWICSNQWPFQEPKLEKPTIHKAHIKAYVREYPQNIWPNIWYNTSISSDPEISLEVILADCRSWQNSQTPNGWIYQLYIEVRSEMCGCNAHLDTFGRIVQGSLEVTFPTRMDKLKSRGGTSGEEKRRREKIKEKES